MGLVQHDCRPSGEAVGHGRRFPRGLGLGGQEGRFQRTAATLGRHRNGWRMDTECAALRVLFDASGSVRKRIRPPSPRGNHQRKNPRITWENQGKRGFKVNESGETRTLDPRIKSPLLYRLSYALFRLGFSRPSNPVLGMPLLPASRP